MHGELHGREIARRINETAINGVQQALIGLESDGLVVGRTVGTIRLWCINPAYFAKDALCVYLDKLLEARESFAV